MEVVQVFYDKVVKGLAKGLYSISAISESEGKGDLHAKIFYLSPEQHVIELFLINILVAFLLYLTFKSRKHVVIATITPSHKIELKERDIQVLGIVPKILRLVLTICFLITIIHKYMGDKLALMMMPCHFVSVCYLASLYSKKHSTGEFLFNLSVHYMFFTWLALLLPDYRGLSQPGEIINFWVHHWVLLIIPLYLIYTDHYTVYHFDHYYFRLAAAIGALVHFDIMSIGGIITGHNVGYMLAPPPKTIVTGGYFRWAHALALIVFGWISGYLVPWLIIKTKYYIDLLISKKKIH